jgi:hypothetical protein
VLLAPRATICALALVMAPNPSRRMMIKHLNMAYALSAWGAMGRFNGPNFNVKVADGY